jgi:hypothetical protein
MGRTVCRVPADRPRVSSSSCVHLVLASSHVDLLGCQGFAARGLTGRPPGHHGPSTVIGPSARHIQTICIFHEPFGGSVHFYGPSVRGCRTVRED